ncbi:NAD(P)H-dependent oxidoreductase [Elizabethkingia sp. HX WHF]|uniref:NADPH-dependent FMN reductase n=1 Tax=Elizabethkingia TaxID=308865 RepID=UPI00099ADD87|nr:MULTISPECIES: NAD(P)H-dependent oxidoreductase [Elizabethkingia]ATL42563.1 NADPH-dependent oxidoreductase [Elizabethkingia miricola]MCL1637105.1 NAD(P)H-dependent oxidoreductase [Elizabethkingia bruuniana]MDX8563660.1 NAD(P)H-dependent oxidoreductase [Elizabethkingia sp. HX WHF]OPC20107.1 NADPH-dependent FMN reductase [Elizabethkingia bruuniana]
MKIVAFAGTNSPASINKVLVEYVTKQFDSNDVELLDLNDYEMPIYGVHREQQSGVPQEAKNFAEKIDSADLVIMSLAEHNSSYSVAFKNVFDWVSRIPGRPHWGDKDVFLMATAPGPKGGANVLAAATARFPHSGANIVETFSLPKFKDNFDAEKGILDAEKARELEHKIAKIKEEFAAKVNA